MGTTDLVIRRALASDVSALVDVIEMASEGPVTYVWAGMAEPGETPRDVGLRRAAREEGAFSYRNATVATGGGRVRGGIVGYAIGAPQDIAPDMPAMFVPLQQLENLVPGSWYVNVLAVMADCRGRGIGGRLLMEGDRLARESGCGQASIIVSNGNPGARRLYERHGFFFRADRPMGDGEWENPGTHWELLVKNLT